MELTDAALFAFAPDPVRGAALDARMQAELLASLTHLSEAAAVVAPEIPAALQVPCDLLAAGQALRPAAFGLYFELASALVADDLHKAYAAATRLSAVVPRSPGLRTCWRGSPDTVGLEQVLVDRMGAEAAKFAPITKSDHDAFAALVDQGLALLDAGAPDLASEIRAILSELMFAQAPPGALREFDGASHYQFWGLMFLNPRHHRTPLAVAEVLAHEAGHSLLFGLTVDEPLVLNPDDALFPSPLRIDPRPMDGIFHATFVSARMAWAMERLAESGVLDAADRARALDAAASDRANFDKGIGVVDQHGRLSDTGRAIIENARTWVRHG